MKYHPRRDNHSQLVELKAPSKPTPSASWNDLNQIATVIPDGPVPTSLNGITLAAWTEAPTKPSGWEDLASRHPQAFTEPPMVSNPGKSAASGVVILEGDGRVWVVSPSNAFGGYVNTFPKGKIDRGLSLRANALKECHEESGLQVELTVSARQSHLDRVTRSCFWV